MVQHQRSKSDHRRRRSIWVCLLPFCWWVDVFACLCTWVRVCMCLCVLLFAALVSVVTSYVCLKLIPESSLHCLCFTGGYTVTLDISLLQNGMDRMLSYLQEGAFLDRVSTSNVKVSKRVLLCSALRMDTLPFSCLSSIIHSCIACTMSTLQLILSTYSRETQVFSNNIFTASNQDSGQITVDISVQVRHGSLLSALDR